MTILQQLRWKYGKLWMVLKKPHNSEESDRYVINSVLLVSIELPHFEDTRSGCHPFQVLQKPGMSNRWLKWKPIWSHDWDVRVKELQRGHMELRIVIQVTVDIWEVSRFEVPVKGLTAKGLPWINLRLYKYRVLPVCQFISDLRYYNHVSMSFVADQTCIPEIGTGQDPPHS